MNRYEQEFYKNIERIAVALEKLVHCQNTEKAIKSYNYEQKIKDNNRKKQ